MFFLPLWKLFCALFSYHMTLLGLKHFGLISDGKKK